MVKGLFSAYEWARKGPPYLGAAFGASCQRFIIYSLPDLEPSFTQLAMSTVYCFILVDRHFTITFILFHPERGD
jgi:hypothetical protein